MKAGDVMTRSVVTVEAGESIDRAIELMLDKHVSGLPVVDKTGRLVGIVTEGDFLRRVELGTAKRRPRWIEFFVGPGRLADEYVRTHARKVAEVMTTEVEAVAEDTPLDEIVGLMLQWHVKRLPVLRDGALVGIVSRADLMRALARELPERRQAGQADADLRRQILAELDRQVWAPLAGVDVRVEGGEVHFGGTITDERERQALRVAAESVPGVKSVHDHLCWIEPVSGWVIDKGTDD